MYYIAVEEGGQTEEIILALCSRFAMSRRSQSLILTKLALPSSTGEELRAVERKGQSAPQNRAAAKMMAPEHESEEKEVQNISAVLQQFNSKSTFKPTFNQTGDKGGSGPHQ